MSQDNTVTQKPSHVRFWILGMATMMSFMLYLDRFFISFLLPYIDQELALGEGGVQLVISMFFWSYAAMQVPAGWLSDKFGARLMLAIYIAGWSLFTGLIGIAESLVVLLIFRLGMGITQAGAYPTGASIVSKWVPFYGRATASSIVAIGGRLGGALQNIITALLLVAFVPITVNSFLQSQDVLDPVKFSQAVANPKNVAAVKLSQMLGTELDQNLGAVSNLAPDEQREKWQSALNNVLKRKNLVDGVPFDKDTLPADLKKLVEKPTKDLSEKEIDQRNRLLWESSFPTIKNVKDISLDTFTEAIEHPKGKTAKSLTFLVKAEANQNQWQTDLNELLKRPDLFDLVPTEGLKLPLEATQLATVPEAEATEDQIGRRNRLLLETAFPGSLRYIYGEGWRPVAFLFGGVGFIVALVFFLVVRNRPAEHPGCNAAELELINKGRPEGNNPDGKVGKLPIKYMATNRSLWCSSLSQFGTNFGWAFVPTQVPMFLEQQNVPTIMRGFMTTLPLLLGMVGMFAGGWLTDVLTRKIGVRWGRGLPMALTRFTAMAAFLVCLVLQDPWLFIIAFCCVTISTDLGTSAVWAFKQDVGGRYVGSVLGWGNMWGNFGAAVLPLAMIYLSQTYFGDWVWEVRFLACAGAFAIAGIAALGVDATKPIVPQGEGT